MKFKERNKIKWLIMANLVNCKFHNYIQAKLKETVIILIYIFLINLQIYLITISLAIKIMYKKVIYWTVIIIIYITDYQPVLLQTKIS